MHLLKSCNMSSAQLKRARGACSAVDACVQDYDLLCNKLKELSTLGGINGLLMWDEMVSMLALMSSRFPDTAISILLRGTLKLLVSH